MLLEVYRFYTSRISCGFLKRGYLFAFREEEWLDKIVHAAKVE